MKPVWKAGLIALAAVLLIPSGPDRPAQLPPIALLIARQPDAQEQPAGEQRQETRIRVLETDGCREEALDDYLTRVLMSELPAEFALEAMKAQAVAARTFALRGRGSGKHPEADVCTDSACCQACLTEQALRERLGELYEQAHARASEAVSRTRGEVLTYEGALIDATYFSCSGGSTEDAVAVWGGEVPYLRSVESPGEQDAARYASTVRVTKESFRAAILGDAPEAELSGDPGKWIGKIQLTRGGGVEHVEIGGVSFSGTRMRQLFALNSTKFTLTYRQGEFVFDVLGFGHRVGMSQYGAQAMAELGFDYRTILLYYYRGVRIETQEE